MTFLGIDQSLNATGACRLSGDAKVQALITVDPSGHVDGPRLDFVKRAVAAQLDGVDFAALEGYSYDSVGRVFELGEIGGVLKVLLIERGVAYVVVPPAMLKKYATGSSTATKEAMVDAACERGCLVTDDNQADAFFLAHIARSYTKDTATRRCELEVIRNLRNPIPKKPRRRVRRLVNAAV